jgi:predicted HicB family RNase H-like nuclease
MTERTKNLIAAVPESMHRAVKQEAADRGISMAAVVVEFLQPLVAKRNGAEK